MVQQQPRKRNSAGNTAATARRGPAKTKWTITGVSAQTRRAVTKAARKKNQTIGDWVDETLHAAATASLKGGAPILALPPELLSTMDDMARKLDNINSEIEQDPERYQSIATDIRTRIDDLRNRMNGTFERLQVTTKSMVGTLAEQTDSAVSHSRQAAGKTLERVIDAGDATLASMRKLRRHVSYEGSRAAASKHKAGSAGN